MSAAILSEPLPHPEAAANCCSHRAPAMLGSGRTGARTPILGAQPHRLKVGAFTTVLPRLSKAFLM
ncbi:hypothetical protein SKAU_G00120080 [Synaphobranchus kaupii]|uniref:Uncharacterized protein n=1 Tax=Synaphobranchus kaupii TaxID=118154 RepID=A0A9Q1FP76_SYNKA|nr:hypothetical protein SKAU_G00120080 [Synaphobranchus kaupii]